MSFFYDLNKKLDSIRATPEVTHQQLNERNMSQHAKGIEKYTKPGMQKLSKLGREGASKAKMDATRKEFNQYANKSVDEDRVGPTDYGPMLSDPDSVYYKTPNIDKQREINKSIDKEMGDNYSLNRWGYGALHGAINKDAAGQLKYVDRTAPGIINKIKNKLGYDMPDPAYGPRPDETQRLAKRYPAPTKESAGPAATKPAAPAKKASPGFGKDYKPLVPDTEKPGSARGTIKGGTFQADPKGRVKPPSGDPEGVKEQDKKDFNKDIDPKFKDMPKREVNRQIKQMSRDYEFNKDIDPKIRNMPKSEMDRQMRGDPEGVKEAAGSIDYEKVLEAIAALYGDDMWDNDAMGDLAQDLEQAGPTDRELDFIIAKGKLPTRLKGIRFTNTDDVQFGHLDEKSSAPMTPKQKSFAKLAPPANKITFADKIAGAKKEVDEMLGDVAAEAMRSALGGGRGRNAEMDEERSKGTAFDMSTARDDKPKVGSIERGAKHDIKHTATGRVVTRRTDDQGHSVGADDEADADAAPRGRGRPKGTKNVSSRAKVFQRKSKLMTKEGEDDPAEKGEYDREGDMALDDIDTIESAANELQSIIDADDNLPEWVQSKINKAMDYLDTARDYMAAQGNDQEPIAEKAVSKQQQKFMGMAHAMQKGEKVKGASKELKTVARTMKPKDTKDFAKTKHKGLPDKVKKKEVDENSQDGRLTTTQTGPGKTSTSSSTGRISATVDKGKVEVKPAKSSGMSFGKGIYDSMNRELEQMIAESMNINMSDSTEGDRSLTVTATDDDAMKLAMILKSAGLGSGDMHSHSEQPCPTCGMPDCGCGDVQEAVDENAPDYPTNTQTSSDALQYAGGLNKPKTDVAGDGQTTVPVVATRPHNEDALRRMMEMAGLAEGNMPMVKKDGKMVPAFAADGKGKNDLEAKDKEDDTVDESIRRMMEIAGVKKKPVDEEKTEEGNLFTKGLEDDDVKIGDKIPGTNAIKKKDIDESIFTLTNQWRTYKG